MESSGENCFQMFSKNENGCASNRCLFFLRAAVEVVKGPHVFEIGAEPGRHFTLAGSAHVLARPL